MCSLHMQVSDTPYQLAAAQQPAEVSLALCSALPTAGGLSRDDSQAAAAARRLLAGGACQPAGAVLGLWCVLCCMWCSAPCPIRMMRPASGSRVVVGVSFCCSCSCWPCPADTAGYSHTSLLLLQGCIWWSVAVGEGLDNSWAAAGEARGSTAGGFGLG